MNTIVHDLTIVTPAFNEALSLPALTTEWTSLLNAAGISFIWRIYDDGSKDETAKTIADLAARHPELCAIHQSNQGHGPTILRGYDEARTAWVFQLDADGEMPPEYFLPLWQQREAYDLLLGVRQVRTSNMARRALSFGARKALAVFFGASVADANTPYRLMRRSACAPLWSIIPRQTFAPNVILSGLAMRHQLRILEVPIVWRARTAGQSTLKIRRLLKIAWRCFMETRRAAREVV